MPDNEPYDNAGRDARDVVFELEDALAEANAAIVANHTLMVEKATEANILREALEQIADGGFDSADAAADFAVRAIEIAMQALERAAVSGSTVDPNPPQ